MRIYTKRNDPSLIVSHLTLRRIVGILGISLPLLCLGCSWLGLCNGIQDSISLYYGTPEAYQIDRLPAF